MHIEFLHFIFIPTEMNKHKRIKKAHFPMVGDTTKNSNKEKLTK